MSSQTSILTKIPFLRYAFALGLGIVLHEKVNFHRLDILLGIGLILIGLLFWLRKKRSTLWHSKFYSAFSALIFILLGIVHSSFSARDRFSADLPLNSTYTATILEKSPASNQRYKYLLKISSAFDSIRILSKEKILLFSSDSSLNSNSKPGNQVLFSTKLHPITCSNNPGEFNYKRFMEIDGIRYQAYVNSGISILPDEQKNIKTLALNLQQMLVERYKQAGIEDDELAVLAALTLGDKNYLSGSLKKSFASSGAIHVLAVSGLHVGIIYLILKLVLKPLSKFKKTKIVTLLFSIILLWVYAFITGLSPSVLRSCTMFSLLIIGENLNRKTNIYNTLAFSAFALMLFNPFIIYKVGFQLSYAAVSSIVFFQPKIATLIKSRYRLINWSWQLFAVSLAAQLGTFPLCIFYFHQFPVYFWMSNFIVIPAATILLYGAFLFFATLSIPAISDFLASILEVILKLLNYSIQFIEQIPGALIQHIWIDKFTLFFLYFFIIVTSLTFLKKQIRLLMISLSISILIVVNSIFRNIQTQQQNLIVFYNNYSEPLLSIIAGTNHYYYSSSDSIGAYSSRLLDNASSTFHTSKAIRLKNNYRYNDGLFLGTGIILFKETQIEIQTAVYVRDTPQSLNNIIWKPKKSSIDVKKTAKYRQLILKNSKLIMCKKETSSLSFTTMNNSALILYRKKGKENKSRIY